MKDFIFIVLSIAAINTVLFTVVALIARKFGLLPDGKLTMPSFVAQFRSGQLLYLLNMKKFINLLNAQRSVGLMITRVLAGGIILWASLLKLTGPGFSGIGEGFAKMGIPVPDVTGPFILLLDSLGGIALILGLFTRYLGVLFMIEFIIAFFAVTIGLGYSKFRIDVALIAFAVLFATHGGGEYSLDKVLKLEN